MYNENKLKEAVLALLISSMSDAEEAQETVESVDWHALTRVLAHRARPVYAYEVNCNGDFGFNYRGRKLFSQNAALLCSEMEESVADLLISARELELWVLEDNTIVLCSSASLLARQGDYSYEAEYREIKGEAVKCSTGIDPDDLLVQLDELCYPVYESEVPYYETEEQ